MFEGASVFRDDGQLILKEGDVWTVFKFHPALYANTMAFPPSGPFVSANYVKLVQPAYWQLHGRFPATLSFRSIQEMQGILAELGSSQQLQIVAEFALHVVPFGTLTDKIATGEGGDWDEVLLTTAGDALFVVSFGFGGTTAAARLAQARIAAGSVGVNLFGAGYETFKASTDEEGLTTARGANIFAGLLFAMLDAKELRRLNALRRLQFHASNVPMPGSGVLIDMETATAYQKYIQDELGIRVEIVSDLKSKSGDPIAGKFSEGVLYLNKDYILSGKADFALLIDEWSHAWNHVHGRGKWIPHWKSELDTIMELIHDLGSSSRLPRTQEYLFHQLELLNFLNSPYGSRLPFFLEHFTNDLLEFLRYAINNR